MKVVTDRLDYLAEALDRLNKFDWKSVLLNTILTISTALALNPEKAKIIWDFVNNMLAGVVPLPH